MRILGFSFGLCFPEDMGNPNESRLHMHDLDRPSLLQDGLVVPDGNGI